MSTEHTGGTALRVEGVYKAFDKLEVLRGIDLTVSEHEVVCLIGASGSGKSTLLRCVNLLEPIDAGRIVAPNPSAMTAINVLADSISATTRGARPMPAKASSTILRTTL